MATAGFVVWSNFSLSRESFRLKASGGNEFWTLYESLFKKPGGLSSMTVGQVGQ